MSKTYYIIEEWKGDELRAAYCATSDKIKEAKQEARETQDYWCIDGIKVKLIAAKANKEIKL